jgi:hypothetical protein
MHRNLYDHYNFHYGKSSFMLPLGYSGNNSGSTTDTQSALLTAVVPTRGGGTTSTSATFYKRNQ